MNEAVSPGALSTLFTDARTHNGWRETPVSDGGWYRSFMP